MSKRALRRHHYRRLKKKRMSYWGGVDDETAAFAVNTPTPCSSPCCGNARKYEGVPAKEARTSPKPGYEREPVHWGECYQCETIEVDDGDHLCALCRYEFGEDAIALEGEEDIVIR